MSNSLYCTLKYQESKHSKDDKKAKKPFSEEISAAERENIVTKNPDIIQNYAHPTSIFNRFKKWIKRLKNG